MEGTRQTFYYVHVAFYSQIRTKAKESAGNDIKIELPDFIFKSPAATENYFGDKPKEGFSRKFRLFPIVFTWKM